MLNEQHLRQIMVYIHPFDRLIPIALLFVVVGD